MIEVPGEPAASQEKFNGAAGGRSSPACPGGGPCAGWPASPVAGCCTGACTTTTCRPPAGDPGFELPPALRNRYEPAGTRRCSDAPGDAPGLERARARAWTPGRVLHNRLWAVTEGRPPETVQLESGRALRAA